MRKRGQGRRGLSPVVATVLLITIALVLAVIIYFWARSFIGESVQKQDREISASCGDVSFKADATISVVTAENTGAIPIHGVEIREKAGGEESIIYSGALGSGRTLTAGRTDKVTLIQPAASTSTLVIVPILLGETETERKQYICDKEYGVEVEVGA